MTIPRRLFARKRDEAESHWWVTWDGNTFVRNIGHLAFEPTGKSELIVTANGLNDPHLEFPLAQHERFQPARNG